MPNDVTPSAVKPSAPIPGSTPQTSESSTALSSPPISGTEVALVERPKAELVAGERVAPIVPRTIDEVGRVAKAIIIAKLAPSGYEGKTEQETASKIMIGIMKGAEVGLPPITALSTIAIINNRPCIWGDGAVALVQARGKLTKMTVEWSGGKSAKGPTQDAQGETDHTPTIRDFSDDYVCIVSLWRIGQEAPYVGRFSVRDAKRAGLWGKKAPWVAYPERMLFNRARAFPLRDGFADCLAGLSIREEVEDLPAAPPPAADTAFLDTEATEAPKDAA